MVSFFQNRRNDAAIVGLKVGDILMDELGEEFAEAEPGLIQRCAYCRINRSCRSHQVELRAAGDTRFLLLANPCKGMDYVLCALRLECEGLQKRVRTVCEDHLAA